MLEAEQDAEREAQDGLNTWDVEQEPEPAAAPEPDPEPIPAPTADPEPEPEPPPRGIAEPSPELPVSEAVAPPLDWSEPVTESAEPEPAETAPPEPDVSAAIAEIMKSAAPDPDPTPARAPAAAQAEEMDAGPAARASFMPRRPLDESLMAILREEAEREAAARRAEGGSLETQDEMNLQAAAPPPVVAPAPLPAVAPAPAAPAPAAKPRAPEAAAVPEKPLPPPARPTPVLRSGAPTINMRDLPRQHRRLDFSDLNSTDDQDLAADLSETPDPGLAGGRGAIEKTGRHRLPDIEEINSSLTASADRGDIAALGTPQQRAQSGSGFRIGFSLVLILATLAVLTYAFAPRIAAAVPALEPALAAYVQTANDGRAWLDDQLRAVIEQVRPSPEAH